jgi:predicted dehydrogenase
VTWRPPVLPIRVGIVGLGNVALGFHIPALLALPDLVRVVAVVDPAADRRSEAVRRLGLDPAAAVADPETLLERGDVDVVDLATPPHIRTALARRAIAAGCAVLCEKPLATVPSDAAAIVAAASAAGVPVGIVHNYLAFPEIIAARAAIEEGAIGRPELAILNYLGVEDRPGSAAWRPNWRHDPGLAGGGVLMDMMHVVYVAEHLLGEPVQRVSAQVVARSDDAPVEDVAVVRLESARSIALVNVGWGLGPGGITVSGPEGRVEITYAGGGTGPFAPRECVRLVRRSGPVEDRTPARPAPPADRPPPIDVHLTETFRSFYERLAAGRHPVATAGDGLRVLETTLAAYASAATGRIVSLPLAADDPVHRRGLAGLADLALDPDGPIARRGVFGVGGRAGKGGSATGGAS